MHYAVEDLCAGLACHWGVWVKPPAFWAIFPEVPPCGGKEPRMTCQFGQDCHCTSVWLTVLRKLIPLTLILTLTLAQQLCCDSGLKDFYTLMNPCEPWGDNDDGLRFLCCVACFPSVIPGTSANALHVSKVRRPPCAFEVPLVGC